MRGSFFERFNNFFPFRKLVRVMIVFSICVQMIIISYNHLSGYSPLNSFMSFLSHVMISSAFTFLAVILVSVPDLLIIRFLNQYYNWGQKTVHRIVAELLLIVCIAVLVSVLLTLFVNWADPYEHEVVTVLINNALIGSVLNIIMTAILEAWLFFMESTRAKKKAWVLERELSQIRFEVLKNQINPHFMFNSLNVLSGLLEKDISKAQQFIDEFARIYRYVLDTIEKPVVTLKDEMDFIRSYMFLQQIRYGDALTLTVAVPAGDLDTLMPPLSLQLVLENAVKHNIVNALQPLEVQIYCDDDYLIVKNNVQPKISSVSTTRLGQKNLAKRYGMICEEVPLFILESNYYIVRLPLIRNDFYESNNC